MQSLLKNLLLLMLIITFLVACESAHSNPTDVNSSKTNIVIEEPTTVKSTASTVEDMKDKQQEIKKTLRDFINSVTSSNVDDFHKLVDPKGLFIIRHILWGTDGARGKNIRDYYPQSEIPSTLQFPVPNEMPFDPSILFALSILDGAEEIPIMDLKELKDVQFNFYDHENSIRDQPSIKTIIELCEKIIKTSNDIIPQVFILGDNEFVLTESDYDDVLFGNWAIFSKEESGYKLTAMINFP